MQTTTSDIAADGARQECIDEVLAQAGQRLSEPQHEAFGNFARGYFHHVDTDDLKARSAEDHLGALLSCWQFAAQRDAGAPKLRVLSPSLAEHGWASRHSVIEIVNDDMPFLVDSTTMEINRQGLTLHLIVHPIFVVERDEQGQVLSVAPRGTATDSPRARRESWMHIEVDRMVDPQQRADLADGLERVLEDVRAAVEDWKPMQEQLRRTIAELGQAPAALPASQVQEYFEFAQWLAEDHMTLLGYRCHDLVKEGGEDALRLVPGSGLGLLRETPPDGCNLG